MVKNEFVSAIAEKTGMTKKDTAAFVDALSEVLMEVIANEDSVKVGNVVTIGGKTRPAREAHDPRDPKKKIKIPEKKGYPFAKFSSNAKACD